MFGIDDIISGVLGLGKTYIEGKEKQAEFANEVAKMALDFQEKLMLMQTTPKMDAFIKLLYAIKDVIIPLMRPVVSACMTAIAVYCEMKGIHLNDTLMTAMSLAFPGWMGTRSIEKMTKTDK